jgi:hypothetical protein
MGSTEARIARVQKTLQSFEEDIPLLNMRVKDLSPERQHSARKFAEALMNHTRAELDRLLEESLLEASLLEASKIAHAGEDMPCEPAD